MSNYMYNDRKNNVKAALTFCTISVFNVSTATQ